MTASPKHGVAIGTERTQFSATAFGKPSALRVCISQAHLACLGAFPGSGRGGWPSGSCSHALALPSSVLNRYFRGPSCLQWYKSTNRKWTSALSPISEFTNPFHGTNSSHLGYEAVPIGWLTWLSELRASFGLSAPLYRVHIQFIIAVKILAINHSATNFADASQFADHLFFSNCIFGCNRCWPHSDTCSLAPKSAPVRSRKRPALPYWLEPLMETVSAPPPVMTGWAQARRPATSIGPVWPVPRLTSSSACWARERLASTPLKNNSINDPCAVGKNIEGLPSLLLGRILSFGLVPFSSLRLTPCFAWCSSKPLPCLYVIGNHSAGVSWLPNSPKPTIWGCRQCSG